MSAEALQLRAVDGSDQALCSALEAARLPVDDLEETGRVFFAFEQGARTIGFGGLEFAGNNALLRSVVILPRSRGEGHGKAITRSLIDEAASKGAQAIYLLTDTASPFFESQGFCRTERSAAPKEILATRQASTICPASATLMVCRIER